MVTRSPESPKTPPAVPNPALPIVPDGYTAETLEIPGIPNHHSAGSNTPKVPEVPGCLFLAHARAHTREGDEQDHAALPALTNRILDADGHAWPITGTTCTACQMPLIQTHPTQLLHPCCQLEATP